MSDRCSVAARGRGDEMFGTAPPARRFVLLETPGPWGPDVLPSSGLSAPAAQRFQAAAAAIGARLLLVRRPGRHPGQTRRRRWGVVDRDAGLTWGSWDDENDLLAVDLVAAVIACRESTLDSTGQDRPLALVCTQGKHDVCCAVEGRPVAAAAEADPRVEAWECSHLGGDRFAANLLWLPSGHLFGGLDGGTAQAAIDAALDGRVVLPHYRGRYGEPALEQAAHWYLMRELGEDRPEQVLVDPYAGPDRAGETLTLTGRHGGRHYRVDLSWRPTEPQRLTCRAARDARVRAYRLAGPPVPVITDPVPSPPG
jgi:hypothetical protein